MRPYPVPVLLAVHPDTGQRLKGFGHLAFDGQVDFGGEIVAVLANGRVGAVALDELDRHLVENRRRFTDKGVEIRRCHRRTVANAWARVNRPA